MDISVLALERDFNVSLTTYARLFIASLLPEEIDKIIYIDCDALVLGSFEELWNMDLEDNYVGAVLDGINTSIKEAYGFKLEENYFNAGVLLINLKKWREDNVESLFVKFMKDNQSRYYQHDQGIINNVFKNKIMVIDPKFNLTGYFNFLDYDLSLKFTGMKDEYYSKEIIESAAKNPVFVHFCGSIYLRPWFNKEHPYRNLYGKYVELAGYDKDKIFKTADFPLNVRLFHKAVNNILLKQLLRLYPNHILYNQFKRNALANLKEENEKARKLAEQ